MNQFNSKDIIISVQRGFDTIGWLEKHFGSNYHTMVGSIISLYDSFQQSMGALKMVVLIQLSSVIHESTNIFLEWITSPSLK